MPKILPKPVLDEGDFQESIHSAMKDGQYIDYLHGVEKDFIWYKQKFDWVFTERQPLDGIYTFRVVYLLKKFVWREFELTGRNTFTDFAKAIITSMNWDNDHMHSFSVANFEKQSTNGHRVWVEFFAPNWEDDPFPTYKTDQIRVCHIDYRKVPKLIFTFDFGDGHRFDIMFKSVRERNLREQIKNFPLCVDQRGIAPEQYPMVPR